MNTIGNNIKLTFFGESHSPYIGVTIDNLPPGLKIDNKLIEAFLAKRRPKSNLNTSRIENDEYEFISGILNGITTGAALTVLIKNQNTNQKDYDKIKDIPRPSHADYPAYIKYNGYNDYRGGGVFSGRLTALWMIVGAISKQLLEKQNIEIVSHVASIKNIHDDSFDYVNISRETLAKLNNDDFPVINPKTKDKYVETINKAIETNDSVGGIIESAILNLPIGLGEPLFMSLESFISQIIFSIPAVKGIEFGAGFEITKMNGSQANDIYQINNGKVSLKSNNNGGILGGLSTGAPIIIKTAIKPTPSIFQTQKSVNLKTAENVDLKISGRHDPQIVSRVIHVIDAALHYAVLDMLLYRNGRGDLF